MVRAARPLCTIGTSALLAAMLGGSALGQPPTAPPRSRSATPRAYLIHLIDGGDPIVVQKYVEQDGQIRFEKYGGWVGIPRYEVLRIVPDESEETEATLPPAVSATGEGAGAPLYVATRSGATVRASTVGTTGSEVHVGTPEGSLSFHRSDLVGVLRVPAAPGVPEAWITLWASDGESVGLGLPGPGADARPAGAPPPTLSNRPHLLQLANGVVVQVDGFWLEAGEIRFRRLGGVVGFALGEIARLLPQEVESSRGRLAARFVRRLDADRIEVRVSQRLHRVRLIGVEPLPGERDGQRVLEDPWTGLDRGLLVHLEFDRERSGADGDWLAYVYLPNGRMLNAELIRVGLAQPRAEARNIRYIDLFQEVMSRR
jgi:micrococcal nuclease